jgi:hypothetical protein
MQANMAQAAIIATMARRFPAMGMGWILRGAATKLRSRATREGR